MIIQEVQTYLLKPVARSIRVQKQEHSEDAVFVPDGTTTRQKSKEEISAIRARIRSGHYNSEAVLEDISHSFAKILDQLL